MKRILTRRLKYAAFASGVAMVAASVLGLGSGSAYAQAGPPFAFMNLKGLQNGDFLCLGVDVNNGYAQQQTCTYGGSQSWGYGAEVHGLYFQLKNNSAQANQRCLGIKDGSTKTNAQVTGFTCESYTSRPDQYWIPTELPYTYKNPNNGQNMPCWILSSSITPTLAADTSGASLASGALVINGSVTATGNSDSDIWCADSLSS